MKLQLALVSIILFFLLACTKVDLPQQSNNTPIFSFKADNLPFWEAGRHGFFQEAALITNNSHFVFVGKLKNENHSGELSMYLTDIGDTSTFNPEISFGQGKYQFALPEKTLNGILATFSPNNKSKIADALWYFGDGNTSTEINPSHFYPFTGTRRVGLRTQSTTNCVSFMSENINLQASQDSSCSRDFSVIVDTNGVFTLQVLNPDPLSTYVWHIAGKILTGNSVVYASATAGTTAVVLKITNTNGCTSTINGLLAFPEGFGCQSGFATSLRSAQITIPQFRYGMVQITYQTENGNKFYSNKLLQPNWANCEITDFSPFKNNINQKPTYFLALTFSCTLLSEDGQTTMDVKNATLYTAVEVP